METTNHEGDTETSIIDVRTRDLSEFEEGEPVRIHYRDADDEPHKCITGRVEMHYSDRKALIETEEGQKLVVDLSDVTEENLRDFETDEYLGRAMFAESAWEPEQDGEDLREELLGDDDDEESDDDEDDDDLHAGESAGDEPEPVVVGLKPEKPESTDGLPADAVWVEQTCDECGRTGWTSEEAAADARGKFGEPRGLICEGCDAASGENAVLTYEHTSHHGHEADRTIHTKVETKRVEGEIYEETAGLVGFRTPERDGVFFLLDDGTVEYDPHDPTAGSYEVGTNGEVLDR